MKKWIIVFFVLLVGAGPVSADYIQLKSGEVIEGSIIKETSVYVRIDTIVGEDGRIKEYLLDQIRRYDYGDIPTNLNNMIVSDDVEEKSRGITPIRSRIGSHDLSQMIGGGTVSEELPDFLDPANNEKEVNENTGAINDREIKKLLGLEQEGGSVEQLPSEEEMQEQLQEFMQSGQVKSFVLMGYIFVAGFFIVFFGAGALLAFFISKRLDVGVEKMPKTAGFWRRIFARAIDFWVAFPVLIFLLVLSGLFIPLDRNFGMIGMAVMLPGMLLFFWYIYLSPATLNNTYGRYVTGVKILDGDTHNKPSFGQVFKRELLTGLWAIEIFVILFNNTKRRIGDCWAGTYVGIIENSKPWFIRIFPGIIIVALAFSTMYYASPYVNDKMEISKEAKEFLHRGFGKGEVEMPSRVEIVDNEGTVTFKLNNGENYKLYLVNNGLSWNVRKYQKISEEHLGRGFSISINSH